MGVLYHQIGTTILCLHCNCQTMRHHDCSMRYLRSSRHPCVTDIVTDRSALTSLLVITSPLTSLVPYLFHVLLYPVLFFSIGPRLAAVAMSDDMKPAIRALLEAEYSRVGHDPTAGKPAKARTVLTSTVFKRHYIKIF